MVRLFRSCNKWFIVPYDPCFVVHIIWWWGRAGLWYVLCHHHHHHLRHHHNHHHHHSQWGGLGQGRVMIYPPSVSDDCPPPNIPIRTNQTFPAGGDLGTQSTSLFNNIDVWRRRKRKWEHTEKEKIIIGQFSTLRPKKGCCPKEHYQWMQENTWASVDLTLVQWKHFVACIMLLKGEFMQFFKKILWSIY